ncbi:MAG TPA: hypothetical protein VGT00_10600 [Methylomirabilota bacterium]|jgi:hypothetical protein|nr:hypothetical protein [Methylomirabilota bacterium]
MGKIWTLGGLLVLMTVTVHAAFEVSLGATPGSWSELMDISVAMNRVDSTERPALMICLVDASGRIQCHHKTGVLVWAVNAQGHAVCPGADRRIHTQCDGSSSCRFAGVAAPAESFGLLVLRLVPPVFGAPRHDVLDAAVFTPSTDDDEVQESRQIQAALQGLARCIAPSGGRIAERQPARILTRQACERAACRLGESSVTLSPGPSRTAQQP